MDRTAADNYRRERRGNRLQKAANGLCYSRLGGAILIAAGNTVVLTHLVENVPIATRGIIGALAVGAVYVTDKVDGWLARRAAKLLRRPPTDRGKWLDQMVDKATHALVSGSQSAFAFARGQPVLGAVLAANLAAQTWRDSIVNRKRQLATDIAALSGIPIDTGSIHSSKMKLGAQAGADICTQSQLAELQGGRIALGLAHCACTGLSIRSGAEVLRQLNTSIETQLTEHGFGRNSSPDIPMEGSEDHVWYDLYLRAQPSRSERLLGCAAWILGHQGIEPSLAEAA